MKRRYAILAPDHFREDAKTAHGVIAYGDDEIVAVIDPSCASARVRDIVPHLACDAPVVASFDEALRFAPTSLLIGTAPKGGALPPAWRATVLAALGVKLEIVSGLHDMLGDDAELARVAHANDAAIWDVRKPPAVPIFSGAVYNVAPPIVLMVGNDCAVGKMTVALEMTRAAQRAGQHARFVPTGQTGIMIAGWGIAIDRVVADFAPGAVETLVLEAARSNPDVIFVEGQGAINHPAYAPVTLALMYGSAPDALVLVVDPARDHVESYATRTLRYREAIALHEALLAPVKPARVVGIALNTRRLDSRQAHAAAREAREQTGLPVADIVRDGADAWYAAVQPAFSKSRAVA